MRSDKYTFNTTTGSVNVSDQTVGEDLSAGKLVGHGSYRRQEKGTEHRLAVVAWDSKNITLNRYRFLGGCVWLII